MNIAFGVRNFRMVGGAERYTLHLAAYLKNRGHRLVVYAIRGEPMDGVELRLVPAPRFCPHHRRAWETGRRIAARLAVAEADATFGEQKIWNAAVVRPGGGIEATYWEQKLVRRWKSPRLARLAQWLYPKRRYDLRAERLALLGPATRFIVVNSELVRRDLIRWYPQAADRVRVVHNGTPAKPDDAERAARRRADFRAAQGMAAAARVALFMGRDFYRKGLAAAIAALALADKAVPAADWQLVVAGRGNARPYRAQIAQAGLAGRVRFLGDVAEPDMVYAAADVLLFPSHYDPFANVTVEALAEGVPVITTAANGGSEVIRNGANGWVVDSPLAIERMAEHLAILADAARLAAMKREARASSADCRLEDRLRDVEQILLAAAGK